MGTRKMEGKKVTGIKAMNHQQLLLHQSYYFTSQENEGGSVAAGASQTFYLHPWPLRQVHALQPLGLRW